MLEAISDAYGVEVVMGSADVPQLVCFGLLFLEKN